MRTYLRYLVWQLAMPTLVATLALAGAVWLSQSLRFVDLIVNKGLPVTTFFYLTVLLFPSMLLVIMPFALFSAVLFVYQRLTQESELTVMRAVGLSNLQLALPCLLLAALVTAIGYLLSLYLMPLAFRNFKDLQYDIRRNFSHVLLQPGVFNAPMKDVTVYIRDYGADGVLSGILVHDERKPRTPVTMMAETGRLVRGEDGLLFVMQNGNRQELDLRPQVEREVSILYFDRYTLDLAAAAQPPDPRNREPNELFLDELLQPDAALADRFRRELIAEGHRRLTWPLNAMVFALIGLAVMLHRGYDRRGPWRRTLIGVGAAIAVQALSMTAGNLAVTSLTYVPLIYAALIVPVLLASALIMGWPAPRRAPVPA